MRFVHNRKSTEVQEDWVRTELWNASSNHLIKEGCSDIVFQMITYLYTPQIVLFLNRILKRRQFVFQRADSPEAKWAASTALPGRSRKRKYSTSSLVLLLPSSAIVPSGIVLFSACSLATVSLNHEGWKRPLRSSSPTISPSPPRPQNNIPQCTSTRFHLQGWWLHHLPVLVPDYTSCQVRGCFPNAEHPVEYNAPGSKKLSYVSWCSSLQLL